jgi:pyruvate-formate lyase
MSILEELQSIANDREEKVRRQMKANILYFVENILPQYVREKGRKFTILERVAYEKGFSIHKLKEHLEGIGLKVETGYTVESRCDDSEYFLLVEVPKN